MCNIIMRRTTGCNSGSGLRDLYRGKLAMSVTILAVLATLMKVLVSSGSPQDAVGGVSGKNFNGMLKAKCRPETLWRERVQHKLASKKVVSRERKKSRGCPKA